MPRGAGDAHKAPHVELPGHQLLRELAQGRDLVVAVGLFEIGQILGGDRIQAEQLAHEPAARMGEQMDRCPLRQMVDQLQRIVGRAAAERTVVEAENPPIIGAPEIGPLAAGEKMVKAGGCGGEGAMQQEQVGIVAPCQLAGHGIAQGALPVETVEAGTGGQFAFEVVDGRLDALVRNDAFRVDAEHLEPLEDQVGRAARRRSLRAALP